MRCFVGCLVRRHQFARRSPVSLPGRILSYVFRYSCMLSRVSKLVNFVEAPLWISRADNSRERNLSDGVYPE